MFWFLFFFSFSDLTTSSSCGASFDESRISIHKRDPFYVADLSYNKNVYFAKEPRVLGIMSFNGSRTAIINFGDKSEIVRTGDAINGYTVVKINEKHIVVITPSKEEIKWFI